MADQPAYMNMFLEALSFPGAASDRAEKISHEKSHRTSKGSKVCEFYGAHTPTLYSVKHQSTSISVTAVYFSLPRCLMD